MRFTKAAAEFFNTDYHIIRKPRRCVECNRTIPLGQLAARIRGRWEGKIWNFDMCYRCSETFLTRSDKAKRSGDEGPAIGELANYISDQVE